MSANLVLIPFGREYLALTRVELEEAMRRARALMPAAPAESPASIEPQALLDANGMAERTGIPASWWLEQARQARIPHVRAGKYCRFNLQAVYAHLEVSGDRHADRLSVEAPNKLASQALAGRCYQSATNKRKE